MKIIRRLILLVLIVAPAVSQAQTRELADSLIDYGTMYLGKPYRRAGTTPAGFDCSGFTSYVYGHFGIKLPHSSPAQGEVGRAVTGGLSQLQKGDLVLFSGSKVSGTIGHVGIFIGLDPSGESFSFIHSAVHGGVIISHSDEDYYKKRFRTVRRVLPDFEDVVYDREPDPRTDDSSQEAPHQQETVSESPEYYTIKAGDTLSKISKAYGTSVEKLCELNAISPRTTLHIGRKLKLR